MTTQRQELFEQIARLSWWPEADPMTHGKAIENLGKILWLAREGINEAPVSQKDCPPMQKFWDQANECLSMNNDGLGELGFFQIYASGKVYRSVNGDHGNRTWVEWNTMRTFSHFTQINDPKAVMTFHSF